MDVDRSTRAAILEAIKASVLSGFEKARADPQFRFAHPTSHFYVSVDCSLRQGVITSSAQVGLE
jgi:hypothetical protein